MRPVVYDTGVLVAADRNERRIWAEHRVRLEAGIVPVVPAPVVAQASRSPRQAQLRRMLRGCEVLSLDEQGAHRAGALLGKSGTHDVTDAAVVAVAIERAAGIQTGDVGDLKRLISAAGVRVPLLSL
jgi:hypothetical protein